MSQMNPTEGWAELVAVIDAGSISKAARHLGIPRASLSRHIAELEERLGVLLLHRSTRKLTATQAGTNLYRRARQVLADAEAALESVRQDATPRGVLRVSSPPLAGKMPDMFLDFVKAYPEIELELHSEARYVDLRAEGFDVALRASPPRDEDLVGRILLSDHARAVASREYVDEFGLPEDLSQLMGHRCIVGFSGGRRPMRRWPLVTGGFVDVAPWFACADLMLSVRAMRMGHGIALLPGSYCDTIVDGERFFDVLPDLIGQPTILRIVYPSKEYMPQRVRVFVDFVVAWFESNELAIPEPHED